MTTDTNEPRLTPLERLRKLAEAATKDQPEGWFHIGEEYIKLVKPPTLLKLLEVIEKQNEALNYYERVYPEWNAAHFCKRAKEALAQTREILEGIGE